MENFKKQVFERHEQKYRLKDDERLSLIRLLEVHMIPDPHGESTICNIYYDTPDYRLIRTSLEKPVYKEKLRLRSYGTDLGNGHVFLELKKKYHGVVYKRRMATDEISMNRYISGEAPLMPESQISHEIEYFWNFYQNLRPSVYLSYDRAAFTDPKGSDLRVTLDSHIVWRTEDLTLSREPYGTPLLEDDEVLLEIKASNAMPLWLASWLSDHQVRQISFSKYGSVYRTALQKEYSHV